MDKQNRSPLLIRRSQRTIVYPNITELSEIHDYYASSTKQPISISQRYGALGLSHGDIILFKDEEGNDRHYECLGILFRYDDHNNIDNVRLWFRNIYEEVDECTGFITKETFQRAGCTLYTAGRYHGLSKQVELPE